MPKQQPRFRDAGIIMIVSAVLGVGLGANIAIGTVDRLPESRETLVTSVVLVVLAIALFWLGLKMLRRAKEQG